MINNYKLSEDKILRLGEVVEKFPELKEVAKKFNESGVKWAIAAGTATYIYCGGDENSLDDVDIWVALESREKVSEILGQEWQSQSSERHKAENITFDSLDVFTNCRKYQGDKLLLDYRWTGLVDKQLREMVVDGINYKIIAPEDVILLKIANPREGDKKDIQNLEKINLKDDYLQKRKVECKFETYGDDNF